MTGKDLSFHVCGVETASLLAELHGLGFEHTPERAWSIEEFNTLLAMPGVFGLVAMLGDDPAGFLLVRQVVDEAEILTITVRPDYRRQGLAGRLLGQLKAMLRDGGKTEKLFLEVREDNKAARALYTRQGFEKIGLRENYYSGQNGGALDAILMACTLS
ncbi:ribosomal protein S18-alanine N-acetyltransferase [Emcibacter nanhaiensis]|uniref:Ribosomal-protein-alanine N-acetyltransferase n=1 Tax=Emcibacter nanhaiensis TaxID=1505037 RepID=A0A501PHU3_9PROT|nr:ribosomal protein S18-alanine N-acetyltransferase [Emcibacter nanhaiensis]TPD59765.1 ribosomal-protein-alanine N-acetyltransferase [Emcibacter nanhaiensis]